MSVIQGSVRVVDLEGGLVLLDAGDETYQLEGLSKEFQVTGTKLELSGEVAKDVMTIGMAGPVFRVKSAKKH